MTTDIITTELFESRPIRFIQHNGITYVPILDLASAVGIRKRSLLKVVSKNQDDFSEHLKSLQLGTVSGLQETSCLDRDGAMLLMFKVSTNSIKNPVTKKRFGAYKKWQIEKMNKPRALTLALPAPERETAKPLPDWISKVMQHLEFADLFAAHTQSDLTRARMFALDAASKETGINLHAYKSLIPGVVSQEKGYLNPTQIADRITRPERTFTAFNVNKYLENHGYQLRDENMKWQPTEKGEPYTIKIPWTKGSESGLQVLWHERIIAESKMG